MPFTNQATLSYNGNVKNSNITVGEVIAVLSASKTAVMDSYKANDRVTYVLSIINAGSIAYSGLKVTDNMGEYDFGMLKLVPLDYTVGSIRYYVNGTLQAPPIVNAGPPLVINDIHVPANGNVTLIYEAAVNRFAPLGATDTIENKAVISEGGLSSDVTAVEVIQAEQQANLLISKNMYPTQVTENGQLTYTFTIQNVGNIEATAADEVILEDVFNPILDPISVTFNGTPWIENTHYTYDRDTGKFTTVGGEITVPAATFARDPVLGSWFVTPGVRELIVVGTI